MPLLQDSNDAADLPEETDWTLVWDRVRTYFDAAFYLERYPDVRGADADPLKHYMRFGWKEGRDPGPGFSTRGYLEANLDVAVAKVNPLLHAALVARSNFVINPDYGSVIEGVMSSEAAAFSPRDADDKENDLVQAEMARIRQAFDIEFYLSRNPGVAKAGMDPVEHYVRFGWKEGRDPSPDFRLGGILKPILMSPWPRSTRCCTMLKKVSVRIKYDALCYPSLPSVQECGDLVGSHPESQLW